MNCLKCGQEIPSGQVFCEDCLAVMKTQPIAADTPVYLPQHRQSTVVKKPVKKRTISPEEQIRLLRKRLQLFMIWSLVSTVLALALAYPAVRYLMEDHFKLGQNYSSFSVTEPSIPTLETTSP